MKKAIVFIIGALLLTICACCKVSSNCAREEEKENKK